MLYRYQDISPDVDQTAWVAPSASVIGKVLLSPRSSVWFGAVLRGDNEWITLAEEVNVQENCVFHTDPGKPLSVGARTTVGHMVTLHGCTIGEDCLIGIGAVILNGAKIGRGSLVGAGALVTENKVFPDNALILGSPAKMIRELTPEETTMIRQNALNYVNRAKLFSSQLKVE
jgi:carbonic anhydrase/acetyltransferase-like protein (isoleucine patch superfamily)